MGHAKSDRGPAIDAIIPLLRSWWAGETVNAQFEGYRYEGVQLSPTPIQDPLALWLGGIGPAALDRVARLADGWLTANATPKEALAARIVIEQRASEIGRVVDPEHFGISIPYARLAPSEPSLSAIRQRRGGDGDISEILPVGSGALTHLLRAHIDAGLSKFVLRPLLNATDHWLDELRWLADTTLPLQKTA